MKLAGQDPPSQNRRLATPLDPDRVSPPGDCRNRGIAMLSSWEHRDEDTIKASAQGVGSVLTAAHRTNGEGRAIPPAGKPWPRQSGVG